MMMRGPAQQMSQYRASKRSAPVARALPDFGDMFNKIADFGAWAPKSSRIWRLQQFEYESTPADQVDELEQKVNRLQSNQKASSSSTNTSSPTGSFASIDDDVSPTKSFSEAGDSELAKALSARLQSIATASADSEAEMEEEEEMEEVPPLNGQEMRDLIFTKYGKTYDVSFVRRDIPGKTFVCLNVMWQHLEQRSFKMTEEQYMEKIDSVAYMVNVLGQTTKVRSFLKTEARSQKGLPRRPVVGTAISIQLDLEPELIKEFFGAGYQ